MSHKLKLLLFVPALMLLFGCPQPPTEISGRRICPGKANIAEAVRLLALQKQNVQPFTAPAECTISWRQTDGTEKDENVPGKLAFVPPDKIYFKGDKFGEVRFGTNETEFWLRSKAGDMDSYWWGDKRQARMCREILLFDPANIAEAFGVVQVTTDWKLWHRDGYDILDLFNAGKREKRLYVNTCDYHIELIEYFDTQQLKKASVELNSYTTSREGFMVPSNIRLAYYDEDGLEESSVQIKLKNIQSLPPEKQSKKLFARPARDGYKNVYRLNENCKFEIQED